MTQTKIGLLSVDFAPIAGDNTKHAIVANVENGNYVGIVGYIIRSTGDKPYVIDSPFVAFRHQFKTLKLACFFMEQTFYGEIVSWLRKDYQEFKP